MAGPDESHDETRRAERGSLHELADANREATWADADANRPRVPGVLSGDVGPKGKVAAQLRDLARSERQRLGEVPSGMVVPGTGRYVLAALGGVVLVLVALVALLWWVAS